MRAAAEGAKGATMVAGEFVEGVIAGKQFAIREWQMRKEKRADDVLFARLRARKWQREHPERRAEIQAKYYAQPGVPARQLAAMRDRRLVANAQAPTVFSCSACGVQWCKAPWTRGQRPKFCGARCYQKHRYATDESYRSQAKASARATHAKHLAGSA